jgi:hypothetical protein
MTEVMTEVEKMDFLRQYLPKAADWDDSALTDILAYVF